MEIIKGMKAPNRRGRKPKYPFKTMEVGDTISVDVSEVTIRSSAYGYCRANNLSYSWKVWTMNGKTYLQRTR